MSRPFFIREADVSTDPLHPVCQIGAYCVATFAVFLIPMAAAAAIGVAVLVLGGREGLSHCGRLLRRSRVLIIALFLVVAIGQPGEPVLELPLGPSMDGVLLGLEHSIRLVSAIALLGSLVLSLPRGEQVAALRVMFLPFGMRRQAASLGAVRLGLVLDHAADPHKEPMMALLRHTIADSPRGETTLVRMPSIVMSRLSWLCLCVQMLTLGCVVLLA